jgi:hypothetical protein
VTRFGGQLDLKSCIEGITVDCQPRRDAICSFSHQDYREVEE